RPADRRKDSVLGPAHSRRRETPLPRGPGSGSRVRARPPPSASQRGIGIVAKRHPSGPLATAAIAPALLAFDSIWRQLRRNRFHHLAFPSRIPGRYSGAGSTAAPAIDATAPGSLE